MAFWDFLNEPVGGYNDSPSPQGGDGLEFGPDAAGRTQYPANNMTWGELLTTIGQMSGGSSQRSGSLMPQPLGTQYSGAPGQTPVTPIGPIQPFVKKKQQENTSAGEVMQIAGMFMGV